MDEFRDVTVEIRNVSHRDHIVEDRTEGKGEQPTKSNQKTYAPNKQKGRTDGTGAQPTRPPRKKQ